MPDEHEMTAAGHAALEEEIARLEGDARAAIAADIKAARELGDLSENAEYHDAKERQAHLETRILVLRDRLSKAVITEQAKGDVVGFGSVVEVEDERTGRALTYTLVSSLEADAAAGRLSADSPVAQALRGHRAGETVTAPAPRGERRLKIVSVS
jgi:transcription elongation factor GreA